MRFFPEQSWVQEFVLYCKSYGAGPIDPAMGNFCTPNMDFEFPVSCKKMVGPLFRTFSMCYNLKEYKMVFGAK